MGNVEVAYGLLGSGSSILREKKWIFPPSQFTNCAWVVFGIITEMSAWVVASSWLGWRNAAICIKLSNQAWWSSFIVSVYRKRNASPCIAAPPLKNKKSIFVLHTGYGMKNVFSPSYRKFWRLFFFSNPLLERYFIRFYGFLSILAEFLLNSSILKISRRLGWILYFYDLYAEVWFTKLFRNKISNNNNMNKM